MSEPRNGEPQPITKGDVLKRCNEGPPFTDRELTYSARHCCPCGAGLAYPVGLGPDGFWDCSEVLKGAPRDHNHTDRLAFAIFQIKSEKDPAAQRGRQSTRP